jgi:hypothetical protein
MPYQVESFHHGEWHLQREEFATEAAAQAWVAATWKHCPEDQRVIEVYESEPRDDKSALSLYEFETSCENGWLRQAEYCPDVLDEMERHDCEGRG